MRPFLSIESNGLIITGKFLTSIQAASHNPFQLNHPFIISGVEKLCALILGLLSLLIEKIRYYASAAPSLQGRAIQLQEFSAKDAILIDEHFARPQMSPALTQCLKGIDKHVNILLDYLTEMDLESPGVADCFAVCTALNEALKRSSNLVEISEHLEAIGNYSLEMGELPCFDDLEFLNTINALAACEKQIVEIQRNSH